jgi:parallel beta-helix repeat protein
MTHLAASAAALLDPVHFGAVGDGVTDDTDAWARVLAAAAAAQTEVALHGRAYLVRELVLLPGLRGLRGPGTLIGAARTDTGLVRTLPALANDPTGLAHVHLTELTFAIAEARCAVELFGARHCLIERCHVIATRNLQKGLWLRDGCRYNALRGNHIEAPGAPLDSLVCVAVEAEGGPGVAGYFTGAGGPVAYNEESTTGNAIEGNVIRGGTHGIALGMASRTRIVNNLITGQLHRNINICPASRYNQVAHNQLLEAGSSAVAMAYGSSYNQVTHNQIYSRATQPDWDRDAIHSYVACHGNLISGNVIHGNFRYGVYLAVGSRGTVVQDNRIALEPNPLVTDDWSAGVVLETDWLPRPLPPGARFSRQNYGDFGNMPPYRWAYSDSDDNELRDNLIERASCGLYLAQLGPFCLAHNRVRGNRILPAVPLALYLHADDPAKVIGNELELLRRGAAPAVHLPAGVPPVSLLGA